jgi:hypothetical protein
MSIRKHAGRGALALLMLGLTAGSYCAAAEKAGKAAGGTPAPRYSPDNPFIAGVHPDRRPEGAPVLKEYRKDAAWYERALHGIAEPYPYSLRFLEDQGAWYTPFIHPGMLPPYDIRGWHGRGALARRKAWPGADIHKRRR